MGIFALGMAVAYLLLVTVGAVGSLLALLWLFRDAPDTAGDIGSREIEGERSAEHSPPQGTRSAWIERWEDEAA